MILQTTLLNPPVRVIGQLADAVRRSGAGAGATEPDRQRARPSGDGVVRVYKRIEFCAAGESLLLFLPAYTLFVYGIIVDLHLQKMVDICA